MSNEAPRPGYGPLSSGRIKRRRAHLSTARAGILDVLIDQPRPCTVKAISALIRQHPNTIREHLDGLVDEHLVHRARADAHGRGRPAWLYSAASEVDSEPGAMEYASLASALASQIARHSPDPQADALEAGREWGRELVHQGHEGKGTKPGASSKPSGVAARREVVTLLDNLGFAPSTDDRAAVVKLHHCPLLEAAHQHPEVVCGVHLGIVRGALAEMGIDAEKSEGTALQPFSEPGACRLDLLPRSTSAP